MKRILKLWTDWSFLIFAVCVVALFLAPVSWLWLVSLIGLPAGITMLIVSGLHQYEIDNDQINIHYNRGYKDGHFDAMDEMGAFDEFESDEVDE